MKNFKSKICISLLIILILLTQNIHCITGGYSRPCYPQINIHSIVESETKTYNDYIQLYRQTGLSPTAIDALSEKNGYQTAFDLQNLMFEKPDINRNYILFPFTLEERTADRNVPLAPLKDGDIIITFNTVSCSWRHGHCAIVVDAKNSLMLEHRSAGAKSCIVTAKRFATYPSFMVLRHPDPDVASYAAAYARNQLTGIGYNIFAGIISKNKSDEDEAISSHCSHIVWQAYMAAGVDIDRDKGFIVTPGNIADSEKLQVVQVFGMDTEKYEHRLAG